MVKIEPQTLLTDAIVAFFKNPVINYYHSSFDGTSFQTIIFEHEYNGDDSDEYYNAYHYAEYELRDHVEQTAQSLANLSVCPASKTPLTWIRKDDVSYLIRIDDNPENPQVYMKITIDFTDSMAYINIIDYAQ